MAKVENIRYPEKCPQCGLEYMKHFSLKSDEDFVFLSVVDSSAPEARWDIDLFRCLECGAVQLMART